MAKRANPAAKRGAGTVRLPKVAAGWTQIRDMPAPAKKTFHQMWAKRR